MLPHQLQTIEFQIIISFIQIADIINTVLSSHWSRHFPSIIAFAFGEFGQIKSTRHTSRAGNPVGA